MKLKRFVRKNRAEISSLINQYLNHVPATASCKCPLSGAKHDHEDVRDFDDDELQSWVLNDEGLYDWARDAGVRNI